jgi:hypothetical protein
MRLIVIDGELGSHGGWQFKREDERGGDLVVVRLFSA